MLATQTRQGSNDPWFAFGFSALSVSGVNVDILPGAQPNKGARTSAEGLGGYGNSLLGGCRGLFADIDPLP
jgi:hypothetical protein